MARLRALDSVEAQCKALDEHADVLEAADALAVLAMRAADDANEADAAARSRCATSLLQRAASELGESGALQVRERLADSRLPSADDEAPLLEAQGTADAPSPHKVLFALLSPHRATRRAAMDSCERFSDAAPPPPAVCERLLALGKADCGAHALVRFAPHYAVRSALLASIAEHWSSDAANADSASDDGAARVSPHDAFGALAHTVIAGLWHTAARLALLLSGHAGVDGCGVLFGLDLCAEQLARGIDRASQRADRAAQLGDVRAERAWRDQSALLTAAEARLAIRFLTEKRLLLWHFVQIPRRRELRKEGIRANAFSARCLRTAPHARETQRQRENCFT